MKQVRVPMRQVKPLVEGYPVLQLASGRITLYTSNDDLSNAVFSLIKKGSFSAQYNKKEIKVEKYTVRKGKVELEANGQRRSLELGETIDVSTYGQVVTFYAKTEAEILITMDKDKYEALFFEMKMLEEQMVAVAAIDGYTYHHCERIRKYSIEVWKRFDLPRESLKILRWGSYFHDIGKLAIPSEILNKAEKLTTDEWEIMKSHSILGAEIIRSHDVEWLRKAAFIVEQHHERYDGKGYPFGLKGDEISTEAAIVSVVDAFDAMTTERIYKGALSQEEGIQELIKGKGTQFNPAVVDAFIEILKEDPFESN